MMNESELRELSSTQACLTLDARHRTLTLGTLKCSCELRERDASAKRWVDTHPALTPCGV
jgi:hypothetical protein